MAHQQLIEFDKVRNFDDVTTVKILLQFAFFYTEILFIFLLTK